MHSSPTARDALITAPTDIQASGTTTADTPIRDVMAQLTGLARGLMVTEADQTIGMITRKAVLTRLLNPRG